MLCKGDDNMSCPMLSQRVCSPMELMVFHAPCRPTVANGMMVCHARGSSIVYDVQGRSSNTTLNVVRPCVLPNYNDGIPMPDIVRPFVLPKGDGGMSDLVCFPREIMTCHARHCLTMWLPNGHMGMRRLTSSDHVFSPRVMIT